MFMRILALRPTARLDRTRSSLWYIQRFCTKHFFLNNNAICIVVVGILCIHVFKVDRLQIIVVAGRGRRCVIYSVSVLSISL